MKRQKSKTVFSAKMAKRQFCVLFRGKRGCPVKFVEKAISVFLRSAARDVCSSSSCRDGGRGGVLGYSFCQRIISCEKFRKSKAMDVQQDLGRWHAWRLGSRRNRNDYSYEQRSNGKTAADRLILKRSIREFDDFILVAVYARLMEQRRARRNRVDVLRGWHTFSFRALLLAAITEEQIHEINRPRVTPPPPAIVPVEVTFETFDDIWYSNFTGRRRTYFSCIGVA
jgi:hypothetical protein